MRFDSACTGGSFSSRRGVARQEGVRDRIFIQSMPCREGSLMPMRVIAASEASPILPELYSVDYLLRGVNFDSDLVTVVKDIGNV